MKRLRDEKKKKMNSSVGQPGQCPLRYRATQITRRVIAEAGNCACRLRHPSSRYSPHRQSLHDARSDTRETSYAPFAAGPLRSSLCLQCYRSRVVDYSLPTDQSRQRKSSAATWSKTQRNFQSIHRETDFGIVQRLAKNEKETAAS